MAQGGHVAEPCEATWMPTWREEGFGLASDGPTG